MVPRGRSWFILLAAGLLLLASVLPVAAYTVALYGTNGGLDPALHPDTTTVVKSIPGSAGTDLDDRIAEFTEPSVDVIVIGGDDSFSPSTAGKIEAAVAGGRILVVSYPGNRRFDAGLPATNGGSAPAGQYLDVSDPASSVSRELFLNLPARFVVQGTPPEKEQAVARSGATVLLADDTGMPVLLYWKYGNGYVIQWTTVPVPAYMTAEQADIVIDRLIRHLRPAPVQTTISTTATPGLTPSQTPLTQETTTIPATTLPSGGDLAVYSSPLGASILIDGRYYGTTPANLTSIPGGNHIIRLSLSGYYDYEGTTYVIPGQANHAFGTLQPLASTHGQVTPSPATMPTAETTATGAQSSKGLLDNPSIIVALISVLTASIAAGATIFSHYTKLKKDDKD